VDKLSRSSNLAADPAADRLSAHDFQRLSQFINDYSGIKMPASKQVMLEGRLRRRLRETGHETFAGYCAYLFDEDGIAQEAVGLIDAVTTNKTDFFREPKHFDFLRETALPDLRQRGYTRIRAWSAACSTGAEPYTMAMVIADFAAANRPFAAFILATDLSTDVLREARKGIYPRELLDPAPAALKKRYSRVCGHGTRARIVPELRAMVGFARLNFMDASYPVGDPMQLIFCRNVLIYFDKATQRGVLERLCDCLESGGYLFIGHSESVAGFDLPIRTVGNTIFQKI
jgi:chemotaxis protein methyltransferase CheR